MKTKSVNRLVVGGVVAVVLILLAFGKQIADKFLAKSKEEPATPAEKAAVNNAKVSTPPAVVKSPLVGINTNQVIKDLAAKAAAVGSSLGGTKTPLNSLGLPGNTGIYSTSFVKQPVPPSKPIDASSLLWGGNQDNTYIKLRTDHNPPVPFSVKSLLPTFLQ